MHIKHFAATYPITYYAALTVGLLGINYYNIQNFRGIRDNYEKVQQLRRDSKHLDKVLEEMDARHRIIDDEKDEEPDL